MQEVRPSILLTLVLALLVGCENRCDSSRGDATPEHRIARSLNRASEIATIIRVAFADVPYPGDANLRGSSEGDEPFLLEKEFVGRDDWQALDPKFLDQAPERLSSALSFFSDDAFRFYLPAYLIADLEKKLESADPVFHLCHGLDDASSNEAINPRRYGTETWFEYAADRFSLFSKKQAIAIVAYLKFKAEQDRFERERIEQALDNYWRAAAE